MADLLRWADDLAVVDDVGGMVVARLPGGPVQVLTGSVRALHEGMSGCFSPGQLAADAAQNHPGASDVEEAVVQFIDALLAAGLLVRVEPPSSVVGAGLRSG